MGKFKDAYIFLVPARWQKRVIDDASTRAANATGSLKASYEDMVARRRDGPVRWLKRTVGKLARR